MGGRVSRCDLSLLHGSLETRGVPHRLRILACGVDLMYPTVCAVERSVRTRTTVGSHHPRCRNKGECP